MPHSLTAFSSLYVWLVVRAMLGAERMGHATHACTAVAVQRSVGGSGMYSRLLEQAAELCRVEHAVTIFKKPTLQQ
jgi:hypothetical protein